MPADEADELASGVGDRRAAKEVGTESGGDAGLVGGDGWWADGQPQRTRARSRERSKESETRGERRHRGECEVGGGVVRGRVKGQAEFVGSGGSLVIVKTFRQVLAI